MSQSFVRLLHRSRTNRSLRYSPLSDIISATAMADIPDRSLPSQPELSEGMLQTQKMASLGELVTGVAHEINNPVNFIHGNLGYADRYMQDLLKLVSLYRQFYPETDVNTPIEITQQIDHMDLDFVLEDFPKIQSSMQLGANRIYEIVQSLRTFSHSDDRESQQLDLHQGIESTLTILHNRLKGRGDRPAIVIEKQFSNLLPIHCYAGRINQVLMNLISNALDAIDTRLTHSPPNPTTSVSWIPCISIETTQSDPGWVNVMIRDNGCGMTPAVKAQIFTPFFTTKAVNQGTGLGLAICHKIVEEHQGYLTCESDPETGSTFTIRLPIHPLHPQEPVVNP
jgi:signal transduction histidine kinase